MNSTEKKEDFVFSWEKILLHLSIECCVKFWNFMGLVLDNKEQKKLQETSRQTYRNLQKKQGANYLDEMQFIINDFLDSIAENMGEKTKDKVIFFHTYYYFFPRYEDRKYQPTAQWELKISSLYHCTVKKPITFNNLNWPNERYNQLAQFIYTELVLKEEKVENEFETLEDEFNFIEDNFKDEGIESTHLKKYDEWDRYIFQEEIYTYGELGVLQSGLEYIAKYHCLYRFWKMLEVEFYPHEVFHIVEWVKKEIGWKNIRQTDRYKCIPPPLFSFKYLFKDYPAGMLTHESRTS